MATRQDNWTVEQIGSGSDSVEMKVRDGETCDSIVQLDNGDESVEIRVDDDGVGEVVDDDLPAWAENAAYRVGVPVTR